MRCDAMTSRRVNIASAHKQKITYVAHDAYCVGGGSGHLQHLHRRTTFCPYRIIHTLFIARGLHTHIYRIELRISRVDII